MTPTSWHRLRLALSSDGGIGAWPEDDLLEFAPGDSWFARVAALEVERRRRLERDDEPAVAGNVRPIREARLAASEEIVVGLRAMLRRAERGEFLAVAFAAHVRPSDTATYFSFGGGGDVAHLVTAIERVKLRLLAAGAEDERPW